MPDLVLFFPFFSIIIQLTKTLHEEGVPLNYAEESLRLHGEWQGKIEVVSRVPVQTKDDLSLAYTPGVAQPCLEIQKDYDKSFTLTRRHNLVAVITDGTAVPCWSSWNTGMSHSSFSLRSISKQRGAAMSSRLMPPKLPEIR